jgi:MraZ protein
MFPPNNETPVDTAVGSFVGTYRHTLDAKGRLTIPARWRFEGDQETRTFLALPNPDGSITVYPPEMTGRVRTLIRASGGPMGNPKETDALGKIMASGDQFGCDTQGRIVLAEKLRKYAGLTKEVVLVGRLETFSLWAPELCPVPPEITRETLAFDPEIIRKLGL